MCCSSLPLHDRPEPPRPPPSARLRPRPPRPPPPATSSTFRPTSPSTTSPATDFALDHLAATARDLQHLPPDFALDHLARHRPRPPAPSARLRPRPPRPPPPATCSPAHTLARRRADRLAQHDRFESTASTSPRTTRPAPTASCFHPISARPGAAASHVHRRSSPRVERPQHDPRPCGCHHSSAPSTSRLATRRGSGQPGSSNSWRTAAVG